MRKNASIIVIAALVAMAMAFVGCASGAGSASSSAASDSTASASAASSASADSASASASSASSVAAAVQLENGEYAAEFNTDSSMFHVNEADDGKGVLTVADDGMTIHVRLVSTKITNLYVGTAADAEADEANWLQPTVEEVKYSDGTTGETNAFDIPVPAIDEEFDVAIIGEKGTWYDHKVSVTDPVAQ